MVVVFGGRKSTGYKKPGRLASAIGDFFKERMISFVFVEEFSEKKIANAEAVVFTEKDGERFDLALGFCKRKDIPLINLATGIDIPKISDVLLVDAPNINVGILKTIQSIKEDIVYYKEHPNDYIAFVTEAHQSGKKSVPGTAKVIQEILGGICHPQIASVRSPFVSELLGVPKESLGGFGYHLVEVYDINDNRVYVKEFLVVGRRSYAEGLLQLLDVLSLLENRFYHINEVVENGIL